MTAQAQAARRHRASCWPYVALIALWTVFMYALNALVFQPLSEPNAHAVERHGSDAWVAVEWLDSHPQTRQRLDCPNGRPIWYDVLPDGRYAVVVTTEGTWETAQNVTAMILNEKHFERFIRKCLER